MTRPPGRLAGYAYLAVAASTWGTLPVIVTRARASAVVLACLRLGFGAAALGGVLAAARADLVPRRSRPLVAAMAFMLATSWVMLFRAVQLLGATAVLIVYVFPILVALLAPPLLREPRERHVLPLAVLGLGGIGLILGPQVATGHPEGGVLALGGAILSAGLVLGARRVVRDVPGPVIAFWQFAAGAAILAPWALAGAGGGVPWRWGAVMGVVHTALTGVLFYRAVARIPAQEAGVLMYLEPASAVAFSWVFLSARPTVLEAAGGALVIAAGALTVALGRDRPV